MNKIIKNTLILTVITLVAGLLLGAAYEITKEPIAQSEENAKEKHGRLYFRMRSGKMRSSQLM